MVTGLTFSGLVVEVSTESAYQFTNVVSIQVVTWVAAHTGLVLEFAALDV